MGLIYFTLEGLYFSLLEKFIHNCTLRFEHISNLFIDKQGVASSIEVFYSTVSATDGVIDMIQSSIRYS